MLGVLKKSEEVGVGRTNVWLQRQDCKMRSWGGVHSKSRAGMLAGSAVCVESVDEQKDTQLVTTAQGFEELGNSYRLGVVL